MKSVMKGALALLALSMLTVGASAQGKKAAPKCPACKMTLSSKKSKATPIAVKTKTGTYYCCAGCAMGKAKKK